MKLPVNMRFFVAGRVGFTPRDLRKLGWLAALSAAVGGAGCVGAPTGSAPGADAVRRPPAGVSNPAGVSDGGERAAVSGTPGAASGDAAGASGAAAEPVTGSVVAPGPGESSVPQDPIGVDESVAVFESASASAWVARASAGESAAAGVLRGVLASGPGTPAWSAAVEALAGAGRVLPAELAEPLLPVVRAGGEGAASAASGLRWVGGAAVTAALAELAADDSVGAAGRLTAVAALGERRTKRSAEALVGLLNAEASAVVRRASAEALGRLTGLGGVLGLEASAWRSWWAEAGRLDEASWQRRVSERLASQLAAGRAQRQRVEARLVEAERTLYRSASAQQRSEVLLRLLGDELEPVRRLGLELAEQRLLGGLPLEEPVRAALRSRLTDASAAVRQRAVLLLRDLADPEAAALAAARLAGGQEPDEAVRRAVLLLLARLPQPAGVDAVLSHLVPPGGLAGEAALAAAAAAEAGLLSPAQVVEARARARALVSAGNPPPAAVTLLGEVGEASDWLLIEGYFDSPDEGLRVAAARAWASSSRSLLPLALRAREEVIRSIVLAAAERRGERPAVFEAVLSAPPGGEDAGGAWERALVAMAGRVDPGAVLDAMASSGGVAPELRARLLGAALDRPGGVEPAARAALLLARSAALAESGDVAGALGDLGAVLELPEAGGLNAEAVRAVRLERVRLWLASGDYERAASVASALEPGERGEGSDPAVLELFLAEARRRVAAGEPGEAAAILDAAGGLASEASSSVRREIEALTARVAPSAEAEPGEAPDPAAGDAVGDADAGGADPAAAGEAGSGSAAP